MSEHTYTENNVKEMERKYEPPPKLTKWDNEPTCYDLKNDLEAASQHHDTHTSEVSGWLDQMHARGIYAFPKVTGRSAVVPKLIRKQAEWRYAALSEAFLGDEDLFDCNPVTWEDTKAARQNQLILNHQFNNQIDKVKFIDEYVRAAVDEGSAVVRVGWKAVEGTVQEPNYVAEPAPPELIPVLEQAITLLMQDANGMKEFPPDLVLHIKATIEAGQPMQVVQKGWNSVKKDIINQPTVDVCDYESVIIDPLCKGNIRNANFVIYKFETNLSDLRKAGLYSNLEYIQVDKSAVEHDPEPTEEDSTAFNFRDEPRKKITAYEYWGYWDIDNSGETKPIVATWVGDTLIRMEESPFPDEGLPFVLVQYLPRRKNVYGEPDGALLEDNQKIVAAATRGILDILGRSAAGQIGVRKDALDVTNQRKFDQGRDYQFNQHVDPASAFFTHTFPEIPQSAQWILEQQNFDAESMTGVRAFANTGVSGEGLGRSATAARSALDSASKREIGILRRLGQGIVEVGRKIMAMNAIFLNEEEVIRITNEEFEVIKRDDLAGRIDVKLQISTAETDNAKAEELAFMLQTNGPNSDPAEVRMIRSEIARLRKMPELAKRIEEYEPQPDPMQQQLLQLQILREQKEIEKLDAEINKMGSEVEENLAEADLDRAKARQAHSEADVTDLDYMEQESGVKQEREKELLAAQAQGNAARDVVQAYLKSSTGQDKSSA